MNSRLRFLAYLVATLVGAAALAAVGFTVWSWTREPDESPQAGSIDTPHDISQQEIIQLRQLLKQNEHQRVLNRGRELLQTNPNHGELCLLLGEAATKLGQFELAIEMYQRIANSQGRDAAVANWAIGEIQWHLGQPTASIESLLKSTVLAPDLLDAHERLVWLLTSCGRRAEVVPHAMALIRSDRGSLTLFLDLGNTQIFLPNWNELERFQKSSPGDLLPNLALARKHFIEGELAKAESLLVDLIRQQPNLLAAHVQLAEIWKVTSSDKLLMWQAALPQHASSSAEIRVVQGQWHEQLGESDVALRCWAEAVKIDPNNTIAHINLARLLAQHSEKFGSMIQPISLRGVRLQQFEQAIDRVRLDPKYEPTVQQVAELSYQLDRIWEAIAWSGYGAELNPHSQWHKDLLLTIRQRKDLAANMPHTLASGRLIDKATWVEQFPLPESVREIASQPNRPVPDQTPSMNLATQSIRFEDITLNAGVDFTYKNFQLDRSHGRRMFEVTGGGVGVIDFDLDGNEDIFLTQGTSIPASTTPLEFGDCLYRNTGLNEEGIPRFRECSESAQIVEAGFGQGIAVADCNNDGFDDIYVANYQANQLWINQGDGTFTSANHWFKSGSSYWTASTLAVDVNADGCVDLIDINYATGDNLERLRCDVAGLPRACPPLVFAKAPLVIWVSTGEESFAAHEDSADSSLHYYGLGGVAYMSQSDHQPKVFIAVDQQANGLLEFENQPDGKLKVADTALISGVAFNQKGNAEACMGIAAGDLDKNGEVDLFVTNFHGETNTLYLQDQGQFSDETLRFGLAVPSREMLGFGTQFLDTNLRGELDLVVLNGHIDDLSHTGVQEKMRPQFFLSRGNGSYTELDSDDCGQFFSVPKLGRSLATADLDRNGLMDLLCSDLEQPFSLLQNRSQPVGNYAAIKLVGVTGQRNGFLATVALNAEEYSSQLQLLAGGGYMASNSQILNFTVPLKVKGELTASVHWSDGLREIFDGIQVNTVQTLVQGTGKPPE